MQKTKTILDIQLQLPSVFSHGHSETYQDTTDYLRNLLSERGELHGAFNLDLNYFA